MGDYMARADWSNERKTAARQYDNIHYSVIGCKLPRSTADAMRALCKAQGVSVSAALSQYVRAAIQAGTLDIIRDDDGTAAAGSRRDDDGRRDGDDFTRDGRAAGDNCRNDPPGQKNHDPAFPQGDQANKNDTPGTVDSRPGFDTPGSVDLLTANDTPGTVD